jgi:sialate O-acetylesterase
MNSTYWWRGLVFVFAGLCSQVARAEVKLPAIISDHMVLQADADVPLWGWANPGEEVGVSLGAVNARATADASGKWQVKLAKLPVGGPHELTVKGTNLLTIKDVLVGEVWLGSGQSNMAMTVNRAQNFEKEAAAADWPQIRMFTVTSGASNKPAADCSGSWAVCTPETVDRFSATAYFFGRELHQALKVPVGLINSSVGGTPIESWISPEVQHARAELKPFFAAAGNDDANFDAAKAKAKYDRDLVIWQEKSKQAKAAGQPVPKRPQDPVAVRQRKGNIGGLFNGKIQPLIPYRIRGALWYQGEANSVPAKAPFYQYQLPLLVNDWRSRWGYEFPFAWVQLPNFAGAGRDWPTVRQAMFQTLKLPKTGMAITLDIGEVNDIHPKNKQEVGRRLALWALGTVYGKSGPTSGPLPTAHERNSDSVVVRFEHADGGLVAKNGELVGFEVEGEQGFKPATATIQGDSVVVKGLGVARPTAVRYAWTNNPAASLFNGAGLPASPFMLRLDR